MANPIRVQQSFNLGPLRINLSGSGIGISLGIPGLRVGRDARGRDYIAAALGGVIARKYRKKKKKAANG